MRQRSLHVVFLLTPCQDRHPCVEGAAMGFIQPNLPVLDIAEWSKRTRAERIIPMTRHIAENGFGTPLVMHVMYGVKIALYILGGWFFGWCTTGIGGFTDVATWWSEPIVFQKAVLFTMLF